MKKGYVKPMIEIEKYELNASIASNCRTTITIGPGDNNGYACEEFEDSWGDWSTWNARNSQVSFYDGVDGPACDCYYSLGGEGYFTS